MTLARFAPVQHRTHELVADEREEERSGVVRAGDGVMMTLAALVLMRMKSRKDLKDLTNNDSSTLSA